MAKPKPARTGPSLGQEVIALAILGSGILLLLALFSFDPRDLSFYSQPPQNPKGRIIWEHSHRAKWSTETPLHEVWRREYGQTCVSFLARDYQP